MQPSYQPLGNAAGSTCNKRIGLLPASERKSRAWWPSQAMAVTTTPIQQPRACTQSMYSPLKFGTNNDDAGSLSDGGGGQDQDELNQMLGLLSPDHSASEPCCEGDEPIDLSKAETSESTQLNTLLSTLNGKTDNLQHGCSYSPGLAGLSTVPFVGRDWAGDGGGGRTISNMQLEDSESDDSSLISKRAKCTLDNIARNASRQGAVLGMPTPQSASVVGDAPAVPSSSVAMQQQAPWLQMSGSVGVGVLGSFRPHPAWANEAGYVLYVAVFLTQESRDVLLGLVPPVHPIVSANHMTLAYKPSILELLDYPLGAQVELKIIGSAADSRAQAVAADPPTWLPPTTSVSTHVTISVALGTKPVEAGHLIMDAWQRTVLADPAAPELSGAGAFQHFDEPLALVGRLGVQLVPPAAAVAAQKEIIAYSIEELVRTGYVSIGTDNMELFYKKHGRILGKQPSQLQLSPSPSSQSDLIQQTSRTSTDSYSPLTAGAMPPLELSPPAAPCHPAHEESTTACQTPVPYSYVAPPFGNPSLSDAAGAAAVCQEQQQQPLPYSPLAPTAATAAAEAAADDDDAAEQLLNNSASEDAASTSSGSDVVQFKSAVQIGDYVALRPYVATDDGEKLMQGFVQEYACDEPFQGNGVLVVLRDNTIGFVTAVLDPCMQLGSNSSSNSRQRPAPAANSGRASKRSKSNNKAAAGSGAEVHGAGSLAAMDSNTAGAAADVLSEWALSAREAPAAAGLGRRNAEDAQRDLQLWNEFDALQRQHGESLCNAILQSCNQDFVEAIALIKAQSTCTNGSSINTTNNSSCPDSVLSSVQPALPAAAAAGEGSDEDLVQQLALSLGLSPASAVQLYKLAPQKSPEHIVELLQQHGGNVNKAADALLSSSQLPSSGGNSDSSTPAGRAVSALMSHKDAELMAKAHTLCAMFDGLQMDMAEMLLREHSGDLDQAAEAVSEMQAKELEARTAAAAGSNSPLASQQQSLTEHEQQGLMSEADQLAALVAMGELTLDDGPTAHKARRSSANSNSRQPRSPPKSPLLTGQVAGPSSSYSPITHGQIPYGSPRRTVGFAHHQQQSLVGYGDQEAKKAAKEAADKLYAKSKTLSAASQVYLTAAQALLADNNVEGYREKKAAAEKARADSKAAFEEAQRLSWSANNKAQQSWQIDLHGLGTSVALRKFVQLLDMLSAMDSPGGVLYQVITGKGNHSEDNVPKIKLGVLQYLEEKAAQVMQETGQPWAITWQIDPINEGLLNVFIPGSGATSQGLAE